MKPIKVYAAYSLNEAVRIHSSSGAVFTALAEYVLCKKGIVYGVAMTNDCYSAEFVRVTDEIGLSKLRGSKYLQAKLGNTYKSIRKELIEGKLVLFSGTGCQVNGLKGFLGKEYENLLCVDVICHGVPSPKLWKVYAKYQEHQNRGKIKNINFRCKEDGCVDLKKTKDAEEKLANMINIFIPKDEDSYMQMFLKDYCLRPSCYKCVAKSIKKSDITIADFWGIDNVITEMNDGKGISLVLVRTKKGQKIFDKIKEVMRIKEVSYEDAIRYNPAEYKSCEMPVQRNYFF